MTPEQRLALYGGALGLIGLILLTAAAISHARDHRRQP